MFLRKTILLIFFLLCINQSLSKHCTPPDVEYDGEHHEKVCVEEQTTKADESFQNNEDERSEEPTTPKQHDHSNESYSIEYDSSEESSRELNEEPHNNHHHKYSGNSKISQNSFLVITMVSILSTFEIK